MALFELGRTAATPAALKFCEDLRAQLDAEEWVVGMKFSQQLCYFNLGQEANATSCTLELINLWPRRITCLGGKILDCIPIGH